MMSMAEVARISRLAYAYLQAREYVVSQGYGGEIRWQQDACVDEITESDFLREAAWVVLSAGMRETVVRKCFDGVSRAFLEWASASQITLSRSSCVAAALPHFNHSKKINAIADIAVAVHREGFCAIKRRVLDGCVAFLQQFPFIGPVTSYHLAKNLGMNVVKPDRHLVRIARAAGYESPESMCAELNRFVGDKLSVIDIVLWRYATLVQDYLAPFVDNRATHPPIRLAS